MRIFLFRAYAKALTERTAIIKNIINFKESKPIPPFALIILCDPVN
jgi:hypothetical protein